MILVDELRSCAPYAPRGRRRWNRAAFCGSLFFMPPNASTIALVLAVAAAVGTVASLLGASPALAAYPRAAAFLRLVAALIPDLRQAILALSPTAAVAAAASTIAASKR